MKLSVIEEKISEVSSQREFKPGSNIVSTTPISAESFSLRSYKSVEVDLVPKNAQRFDTIISHHSCRGIDKYANVLLEDGCQNAP